MINLSLTLMITVAVVFLFLLSSLNSMLFKPMLKHMDARKKSLKENQDSANQSTGDAAGYEEEAAAVLSEAKKQAHSNIELVVSSQKRDNEEFVESEKAKIEKEMKAYLDELNIEKEKIVQAIAGDTDTFKSSIKAKLTV